MVIFLPPWPPPRIEPPLPNDPIPKPEYAKRLSCTQRASGGRKTVSCLVAQTFLWQPEHFHRF